MKGPQSKLNQQQEQAEAQQQGQLQAPQQQGRDFGSVEDMLRFDAAQNQVPPAVAQRLQESIEREQIQPPKPWWKRLFWG
jgi:hypothetical protein